MSVPSLRKLDARSHRAMPWKNGGGTTLEIATFPDGATLLDFEWRISMARVETSGPFSRFSEVDRSIALIEGDGLALSIAGGGVVALDCASPAFSFPGDVDVRATLKGSPIEDFNVMTRRGRFRHVLSRARFVAEARVSSPGELTVLVVVSGAATVRSRSERVKLGVRDALLFDARNEPVDVSPEPAVEILSVDLWRD